MNLTNKQKVKLLRFIRAVFDLAEPGEISTKMLTLLPVIVFVIGIAKLGEVVDMFHEGATEGALKKIFLDSNLTTQLIKKIDEAIHRLGG